ncbi:hypothetical protein NITHO_3960005 [Nitrolancea hollandica Lb]|uniref:Uncharacterized protein n=1 Tax=Nitrolancea hollandica Lb TaxID=1129897 RepID=I4EJC9_9BACT|nr:hypothetical protein NITHO_3960005 [Nitrolancea hollandica Lb]
MDANDAAGRRRARGIVVRGMTDCTMPAPCDERGGSPVGGWQGKERDGYTIRFASVDRYRSCGGQPPQLLSCP